MKQTELHTLLQHTILTAEPVIHPYLQEPPKGSIEDRVAIYANGFYARLEEVLASDYPILATLLGEDKFSVLCEQYLEAYPSLYYSVNYIGHHFSQFLMETTPYNKSPYLAEIAAFEWAEYQALVAPDAPLLTPTDLHSVAIDLWPEMIFYLHPSCSMHIMHWNSMAVIQSIQEDKTIPRAKKLKNAQAVFIWRRGLDVSHCILEDKELIILQAIQQNASFAELCERLTDVMAEEEVAPYVVQELYAWLQEHIFRQ
jgi:hypothetical protein